MKHKCAMSPAQLDLCQLHLQGPLFSDIFVFSVIIFSTMRQHQLQQIDPIHPGTTEAHLEVNTRTVFVDYFQNHLQFNIISLSLDRQQNKGL